MSNRGASLVLRDIGARGNGDSALTARFGAAGGVIGRGAQCSWVLADPERILSKEHAAISYREGVFSLTPLGRNGVFVNGAGEPIASGVPMRLTVGDRLRLGDHDILVEEMLPGPAAAPAPLGAAGPPAAPAVAPPPLAEDWESRLGELLRPAGDAPPSRPVASDPVASSPPPPAPPAAVAVQPAPEGAGDPPIDWGAEGPLRRLLLGRAPSAAMPSERYDPPAPWVPVPGSAPDPAPASAEPRPKAAAGWAAAPLPPDAAFLRGIGIGLPQLGAEQAAAIAFDLGRALAALSDMLVERAHRADTPRGNPFAAWSTGPLALSELVASTAYRPGQIERVVRETIGATRRGREPAAGPRPAAPEPLVNPVTTARARAWL